MFLRRINRIKKLLNLILFAKSSVERMLQDIPISVKVTAWYTIYYNYDKIKEIDLVFLPDISKIANFAIENIKCFNMKELLILLLVFVTLIPGNAFGIDIQKESTAQNKGVRMPSITQVEANYENGLITIEVKGYTGGVQAFVSDSQGTVVGYTISSVTNSGVVTLNLGALAEGDYTLNIVLDNAIYYSQFDA